LAAARYDLLNECRRYGGGCAEHNGRTADRSELAEYRWVDDQNAIRVIRRPNARRCCNIERLSQCVQASKHSPNEA
jgi:hypothetical protein